MKTLGINIDMPAANSDIAVTPSYNHHAKPVVIKSIASCAITILGIILRLPPLNSCQDYSRLQGLGQIIRSDFVAILYYFFIFPKIPSNSSSEL